MGGGRLVWTRLGTLSIYSAPVQRAIERHRVELFGQAFRCASYTAVHTTLRMDRPDDTSGKSGSVWNKASGIAVSIGKAAADLPTDLEG